MHAAIKALLTLSWAAVFSAQAVAKVSYVPVQFRTISGVRPFVDVQMNGKPFQMMVHSNANFFVMTTHANAAAAGVGAVVKKSDYGISAPGHVSELGRGDATLHTLQVGKSINHDVKLSVFEVPVPDMQGMLGVLWLRANRVIVDYDRSRLGTAESIADSLRADRELLSRGYVAHRIRWSQDLKSYFVTGRIDGAPANLGVSTVAGNILDIQFADHLKIAHTRTGEKFDGPTGTEGDVSETDGPVAISIDGQATSPEHAQVFDFYAYNRLERQVDVKDVIQGTLGSQFMLSNRAVLDFGTDTLFLPITPRERPSPAAPR